RAFVREQCAKDPDWHQYLERTVPLTERMYSTLLTPITLCR
ncbi:MAG: NIPSNAP family protein, partial [Terriglobales bacterium]